MSAWQNTVSDSIPNSLNKNLMYGVINTSKGKTWLMVAQHTYQNGARPDQPAGRPLAFHGFDSLSLNLPDIFHAVSTT